MIAVIQRVSEASVKINEIIKGQIQTGFLVLLGITHTDTREDIRHYVNLIFCNYLIINKLKILFF